jgi:hypothetical protein
MIICIFLSLGGNALPTAAVRASVERTLFMLFDCSLEVDLFINRLAAHGG